MTPKPQIDLETPGARLRAIRAYCAASRHEFCSQTGLSESTLKAWENNVARLTKKGANSLSLMFSSFGVHCTSDWLLEGVNPSPLRSIEESNVALIPEDKFVEKEFERLQSHYNEDLLFFKVSDQYMSPFFKKDDYLAGLPINLVNIPYYWDETILVKLPTHGTLLRKVLKGNHPGLLRLVAINLPESHPHYAIEDIQVQEAYRIIWHRSCVNMDHSSPSQATA